MFSYANENYDFQSEEHINYCACGCGEVIKKGAKYKFNHHLRGHKWTEEQKKKMREGALNSFTPERIEKMRKAALGNSISLEAREKIRQAKLKNNPGNKGMKHSEETKAKISASQKGKEVTEATRKKLSEVRKGKHPSEETRRKLNVSLHCHHILPVAVEPIESADIDNCITLCIDCHEEKHQIPGCGKHELNMLRC